jgi:tetratricopeptide (TPR) repeat protein
VLTGSFVLLAGGEERLSINLWLQSTAEKGESVVGTLSRSGKEGDLLQLVESAAVELRQLLGVQGLTIEQSRQAETALGMGPEAMRKYSEGLELLRGYQALRARDLLAEAVALEPQNAMTHAALSDAWRALGDDARALESAERAYRLREGLPRIKTLEIEGRYHEIASRLEEAIKSYGALYRFFPESVDYGLRVARLESISGDGQEALRTLGELRLREPGDPRIDLVEAEVAYNLFDYKASIDAARRAEEKASRDAASTLVAKALEHQGNALMQLSDFDRARQVLLEAENRFTEAGDLGSAAVAMNTRATVLFYAGEVDRAEALHRRALETLEEIGNRKEVVTVQNSLALLYQGRGLLAKARALLERAVEQARDLGDRNQEARVLDSLVWVVSHQGELGKARELALRERAIYQDLGVSEGLAWSEYYLGKVELEAGDTAAAHRHLEAALGHLDSTALYQEAYLRHGLAEVLLASGERQAASLALGRALELRRDMDEKAILADTRLLRATALRREGQREEALEAARTAGEEYTEAASPDFEALAFARVAELYLDGGALAAASAALERARGAAPASEYPAIRAALDRAGIRRQAAEGDVGGALARFEVLAADLESKGLVLLAFEVRAERLRVAAAAGLAEPGEVARFLAETERRELSGVAWGLS